MPICGGDTMFSEMCSAYDALSKPIKKLISGLTAIHESEHLYRGRYADRGMDDTGSIFPTAVHPIVRTHPETGRKALFVNRTFTTRINGLSIDEGDSILKLLFDQA
jgi:taurine dioxygenase